MKYCIQCGQKLDDNARFCTSCGKNVSSGVNEPANADADRLQQEISIDQTASTTYRPTPAPSPAAPSTQLTNKNNRLLIIAVSIAVVLFAGYKVGSSMTSAEKIVGKFETALSNKNTAELVKYMESSDSDLKITKDNVQAIVNYLKEDSSYRKAITNLLEDQAEALKNRNAGDVSVSNSPLNLKKSGKTMLFFDKYVVEVSPYYINATTNLDKTTLLVDGKEMFTTQTENSNKKLGPFMPGIHEVKAVYKNEYATIENKQTAVLINNDTSEANSGDTFNVDLYINAQNVTVYAYDSDAEIFINGKDTGKTVGNDGQVFGPLPLDGTVAIQVEKEYPWGVAKSEEIKTTESYLTFNINPLTDEAKKGIFDSYNKYAQSWVEAAIARDSSKITNAVDTAVESHALQFQDMINSDKYFKGSLKKMTYDLNNMRIGYENGHYSADFYVQGTYDSCYYYGVDTGASTSESTSSYNVIMYYNETTKEWEVYNSFTTYYFDSSNTVDYEF